MYKVEYINMDGGFESTSKKYKTLGWARRSARKALEKGEIKTYNDEPPMRVTEVRIIKLK